MSELRKQKIQQFVEWVSQNITGDEKGQAQIFLERLFLAFGQKGCLDVGGTAEFRIRKAKEDGGGVAFVDYVWKPVVLIEMKKRGTDLAKHYRQAFDYWTRLAPDRPRYVVLCDFDEFWVYDFNSAQLDEPVDRVALKNLPGEYGALMFLFPTQERPVFRNNQEEVTRKAADYLATCFTKLAHRKDVARPVAQRFILQMLVALFAEDIGLMEEYTLPRLLEDCKSPQDSYDLLGGLFVAMNTPKGAAGGRFKGISYFNGGLFAEPARVELYDDELNQLKAAARSDWSKVRPEIFGTLFEHSFEKKERHAFGAHFTTPVDIMKIVSPTIVDPWRERIENAKTQKELLGLLERMHSFIVLDPACGSGNFLYVAYRELKRLEARTLERIAEMSARVETGQRGLGFVTAKQFYGIDILPFAVELAKVTMMIARKLAIDELHVNEEALPLDNLDGNFFAIDALIDEQGGLAPWPKADVIIGNPPFLAAKRFKPQRGADYVNAVRKAYPDVPGMADYCVYWFRKAHDHLPACTPEDPFAGRAGLVGTQNIRNNQSRVGGLDHIVKSGTIVEAVDNQPWSGEANVHVSIVNWVKTQDAALLPAKRRLWYKVQPAPGSKKPRKAGSGPASKEYEVAFRDCEHINSALSDARDVSGALTLSCCVTPMRAFRGFEPGNMGFLITPAEASSMLKANPNNAEVLHPFITGDEIVTGEGSPSRWVIDFQRMSMIDTMRYAEPFAHVKKVVLPRMQQIAGNAVAVDDVFAQRIKDRDLVARLDNWWQLRRCVPETRRALEGVSRYIACPLVTRRPIFVFLRSAIYPNNKTQAFLFDDDYSFGVLQATTHWIWFLARCAKLKSDYSYSPTNVFHTFPWPQGPSAAQVEGVAAAGREIRRIRAEALEHIKGGLRALYRTLEVPGKNPLKDAHAALDATVLDAYGFAADKDLLGQLLALNLAVAKRIDEGQPVTSPGVPPGYPNPLSLITDDCIQPPAL